MKTVLLWGSDVEAVKAIRSIIFAKYEARHSNSFTASVDVECSHVQFIGDLVLKVPEFEAFFDLSRKQTVFQNLEAFIYVFDVESREVERDMRYYQSCLKAILQISPDAKVFCLIHKMDLIPEDQRSMIYTRRESELKKRSLPLKCTCFGTSIWDETLYKSWSTIFRSLLSNVDQLDSCAAHIARSLDANEVVVFHRTTYLTIGHSVQKPHSDVHRFEKISNIIKQFNLSCSKLRAQMDNLEIRNSVFAAFICKFSDFAVLVVSSNNLAMSTVQECINKCFTALHIPSHPSTVRSKMNVRQIDQVTLKNSTLCKSAQGTVSHAVDSAPVSTDGQLTLAETSVAGGIDTFVSSLAEELQEAEKRVKQSKKLLAKVTKEHFQKEIELHHSNLKKQVEEQAKEISRLQKLLKLQDESSKRQNVQLAQLKEQECSLHKELNTARINAKETENRLVQEAKVKMDELREQYEQVNEQLEQRVDLAEKQVQELETHWVVKRKEITMTQTELGGGAWGTVKVAKFRGTEVAAKTLHQQIQSDYYRELFIREMNMAARVQHPNLVQFIGATVEGDLIILTELMHTSLRNTLEKGTLSRLQILTIGLDVCRALNYLHLMQPKPMVHRDVSSANVLLDPLRENLWKAKLTDYGTMNTMDRLQTKGPGNPTYSAPEVGTPAQQSPKMDVYSFGILLIEMCSGKFPDVDMRDRLILSIKERSFVKILRKCIIYNRDKRPEIVEILVDLASLS